MWKIINRYGAMWNTSSNKGLFLLRTPEQEQFDLPITSATEFALLLTMLNDSNVVGYRPDTKSFRTGTEEVGES